MQKGILIIIFSVLAARIFPQTGGDHVYEFLNLTHSGLISSLGGSNVSLAGSSLNLAYHNPALLSHEMDKSLSLNYVNYFAGINYGLAMYSRSVPGTGNFAAGINYLNYGSFTEADPSGNITGKFNASEYAVSLIYSREIDSLFTLGINIKPVLSSLEKYTSFGFAVDAGLSWHAKNRQTSAGIVIRNAGYQVTRYAGEPRETLPFEIMAGITHELAYAPFRFSLTYRHLQQYKMTYENGDNQEESSGKNAFAENLLRHLIPGVELIPHKNFYLSAGYNFKRRQELTVPVRSSTAGLTWGFGIRTTWLDVELGRARYHIAGASTNVSLILRPALIYRKER
ncbi:MAG TPA: type IX secretion system protein PorQ [Bacteroidales bacterium]|nr:type IX secretion system protein PorQ [Bacteroidales bacterium]